MKTGQKNPQPRFDIHAARRKHCGKGLTSCRLQQISPDILESVVLKHLLLEVCRPGIRTSISPFVTQDDPNTGGPTP